MENVKIFNAKGEYTMSEDETFKTAKSIALDSALKNLDADVKNFLHDSFKNLDDDDIAKIAEKFLTKNEPRFVRENLTNGDMICYAEIQAEINLIDLNNFVEKFDVFKLEKKVYKQQEIIDKMQKTIDDQQKNIDELNNKFELYQIYLPQVIEEEINIKICRKSAYAYNNLGNIYFDLKNYSQAIKKFNEAISFDSTYLGAYYGRGLSYYHLENYTQAIHNLNKAIEINPNDFRSYTARGMCYEKIGKNDLAEKDFKKARELGWKG